MTQEEIEKAKQLFRPWADSFEVQTTKLHGLSLVLKTKSEGEWTLFQFRNVEDLVRLLEKGAISPPSKSKQEGEDVSRNPETAVHTANLQPELPGAGGIQPGCP